MVRNPPASAGDVRDAGLIPGSGRSPGVGNGNPLQYSCLENPMDRGAWQAAVHGVTKSHNMTEVTWHTAHNNIPSYEYTTFCPSMYLSMDVWVVSLFGCCGFCCSKHSCINQRIIFDQGVKIFFKFIRLFKMKKSFWRRKWQLTPVFLPGKSHGQRSLVGYSP